jgi:CHAT domain-containing protein
MLGMINASYDDELKNGGPKQARLDAIETYFLTAAEKHLGPETPAIATMLGKRGNRLGEIGNAEAAQPLLEKAFAILQKIAGDDEALLDGAVLDLANNEAKLGRLTDAEAKYRRVLATRERIKGPASEQAAFARNNLAVNLDAQKRYAEAEQLYTRAIADLTALGGDQSQNDSIRENYASNLDKQGKTGAATALRKTFRSLAGQAADLDALDTALKRSLDANREGRIAEALSELQQALSLIDTIYGADSKEASRLTQSVINMLIQSGRAEEAVPLAEKLVAMRRKTFGENSAETAEAYDRLASAQTFVGNVDAAVENRTKSIAILTALFGANDRRLAAPYANFGGLTSGRAGIAKDTAEKAKLYAEAEGWYRKALATYGPTPSLSDDGYVNVMGGLASVLVDRGRAAEAIPYREAVLNAEIALYGAVHHDVMVSQHQLAKALLALPSKTSEGFAMARTAVDTLRLVNERSVDATGRVAQHNHDGHYVTLIEAAWVLGNAQPDRRREAGDAAFMAAQDISTTASSTAMTRAAARASAGSPELVAQLAALQAAQTQLINDNSALQAALNEGDAAKAKSLAIQVRDRQANIVRLEAQVDQKFPQFRALTSPKPLSIAEVQTILAPDEAVLMMVPVGEDFYSFGISKADFAMNRVDGASARAQFRLGIIRCNVDPATCNRGDAVSLVVSNIELDTPLAKTGLKPFPLESAYELYSEFVAPVKAGFGLATKLYFTTTGLLGDLPPALLVIEKPADGADYADPAILRATPWFGNQFAIARLPSLAGLRLPPASRAATGGFEGYGSPVLDGDGLSFDRSGGSLFKRAGESLLADPGMLRTLAPLPGTKVELTAMAKALGAPDEALKLGPAATETAIKADKDLATASIIAFATHGLLPGEALLDGEAGLVMTPPEEATPIDDGMLTASEAAALSLSADWVILSACNTASAEGDLGGDSLSGLARGFLYAGARALLASHWRVSDDATAALTVETLGERKRNPALTKSQALQAASTTLRTGKRADGSALEGWNETWSHPANWAPFSVIAYQDR